MLRDWRALSYLTKNSTKQCSKCTLSPNLSSTQIEFLHFHYMFKSAQISFSSRIDFSVLVQNSHDKQHGSILKDPQEELSPILSQMLQNPLAKQSLQLQSQQHAAPGLAVNQLPATGRQLCAHPFNGFHFFPQTDSKSTAHANLGIVIYSSFLSVYFSFCDPISSTHKEQVICSIVQNKDIKNNYWLCPVTS